MIRAKNLAMSRSSFAGLALLLNTGLKRLFQIVGHDHLTAWKHCGAEFEANQYEFWSQSSVAQLCESLRPQTSITFYRIPLDGYASDGNDAEYFFHYNISRLVVFGCPDTI